MTEWHIVFTVLLGLFVCKSNGACSDFTTCETCASQRSWTGAPCRWCPWDNACHAHGAVFSNTCSSAANIVSPDKCTLESNKMCPDGSRPTEQGPRPGPDGCSGVPDCPLNLYCFTDCCNDHDYCYQTCNPEGGKDECDERFEQCMNRVCDGISNVFQRQSCYENSKLYRVGVNELGTSAYLERQHQVCLCPTAAAVSDSFSFFSGLTQVIGSLPVYGWVLIVAAILVVVVGAVLGVYKYKTKKAQQEERV